ncbi:CHRD domain-containing protein [Pedobacter sp. AW1-32]|uniref:CHRD domain-containing protein n=1 Tax=Pedobacter sp. AW1-32 TaxID=3383026 RepID=UPI003FEDC628
MKQKLLKFVCPILLWVLCLSISCKKDNVSSDVYIRKQWTVYLSANSIVPQITGRLDHAVASIYLMDNNELYYYIYFDTAIQNGDVPGSAAIYYGASGQNGQVLINFNGSSFNSSGENDGMVALSTEMANSLVAQTSIYLNVSSAQYPSGLVRGQM